MTQFGVGHVGVSGIPIHKHANSATGGVVLEPNQLSVNLAFISQILELHTASSMLCVNDVAASIAASQNNYAPNGVNGWHWLNLTVTGARNVTGLDVSVFAGLAPVVIVTVLGTGTATFVDQSASSAAANRMALGANVAVSGNQTIILGYDASASRWRPLSIPAPAASTRVVLAVALAGAVNDWAPSTPLPDVLEVDPGAASRTVTGLAAGADGQAVDMTVSTGGASALVLVHNSALSAVANRFLLSGSNRTITVGTRLIYDGSAPGWKALGGF